MKKLSEKDRLFCLTYIANNGNAKEAAIAAGYNCKNQNHIGWQVLQRPQVKQFLEENRKKLEEKFDITIEWKMKKLKSCVIRSLKSNNSSGVIGGIAELNKMQGHYSAEKVVNFNVEAEISQVDELIKQYERPY